MVSDLADIQMQPTAVLYEMFQRRKLYEEDYTRSLLRVPC
jgi:hypothetical protein